MRVAIRVDASVSSGVGHVMRCLTLAKALSAQGATVQFICRAHAGNCIEMLRADGFPVTALSASTGNTEPAEREDYAAWLGASQAHDTDDTIAALHGRFDWMVVDHYGIDADWERRLRGYVDRIMVIDDLANRQHDCDLLLDQNYVHGMQTRYTNKLPRESTCLLGPEYALLRPEYPEQRRIRQQSDGEIRRVFVFFGGTDPDNLTGRTLSAFTVSALQHISVDVVVGANNPNRDALEAQASALPQITLHEPKPHLADLMAKADLAVGAGGTTTWERCCLGLPSLVVSIAKNQQAACEALARDGVIEWVGHHDQVTAADLAEALIALTHDPARVCSLASASRALVDGNGTQQVVDQLLASKRVA
ncbi:UDP-2,4-diacetamido-2,4,6-trideoxy-beta-L-altropyranose hydrolase [Spiribacter roseus]|uniref:UDP-2,4-diacetamido-2,4, 6-trideoxy-beta-L-altropyranose hydrolase n=1 Tax=Spiribacter roseus TaxID=1855875 RepID=UPI00132F9B75|nr:UDP-2,4-diacetamido-2,4,6-trideoxy-beta-L-altropyranose hydrolase [Spiribacter roseus]KAF0282810.1 UDP-2,4-diacetamido-2,4,6-trideoxy-beta-L-altropyranose hydrolase [Spiribacter roseus]